MSINCHQLLFSRLCNDPALAEEVVRLDGLGRLVELCKKETARIGSDGVLVACLAAVRKIAAVVGPKTLTTGDTLCSEDKPIILESMRFPDLLRRRHRRFGGASTLPTERRARKGAMRTILQ